MNGLSVSSMDGCQSMMKSIPVNLRPNHGWKCGISLTLKALYVRNLFHQDRRWMENVIAMFWGEWRKTSGAYVQTSGTSPGPCIMTMLQLTCHSLCDRLWLLWRQQSSPHPPYSPNLATCDFFSYSWGWNWSPRGDLLTALKRSRWNHRTW